MNRQSLRTVAKLRLDAELVRRGLTASRSEARRAVEEGKVCVRGLPVTKPGALVSSEAPITFRAQPSRFVSRGGEKLDAALRRFMIQVEGRRWLDAGASTGGFTDCLLQAGALTVTAVDVGYGQLDWSLRNDPRVVVLERTNARKLDRGDLPWSPEGVTADLSFISLALVLPALRRLAADRADFVLLVKPQFEAGRGAVGRGGVVRDPEAWRSAIERVVAAARDQSLGLVDAMASPLSGPAGNKEFFLHLREGADERGPVTERAIQEAAVNDGAEAACPQRDGSNPG